MVRFFLKVFKIKNCIVYLQLHVCIENDDRTLEDLYTVVACSFEIEAKNVSRSGTSISNSSGAVVLG